MVASYGYTTEQLEVLNLTNYLVTNLIPVTVGNIIGGIVFFGAPMFFLNIKQEKIVLKEEKEHDVLRTTVYTNTAR